MNPFANPAARKERSTAAQQPGCSAQPMHGERAVAAHLSEIEDYLRFIETAQGPHQAHLREAACTEIRQHLKDLKAVLAQQHQIDCTPGRDDPCDRLLSLVKASRSAVSSCLYLACEWLPRMSHAPQGQAGAVDAALMACSRLHARMMTLGRRWPDALCEEGAQALLRALRQAHALMELHPDEMARSATSDLAKLVRELSLAAELDRQSRERVRLQGAGRAPASVPVTAQPPAQAEAPELRPAQHAPA